jgi:hypothetical protein
MDITQEHYRGYCHCSVEFNVHEHKGIKARASTYGSNGAVVLVQGSNISWVLVVFDNILVISSPLKHQAYAW